MTPTLERPHHPAINFRSVLQTFFRPSVLSAMDVNGEYPYNHSVFHFAYSSHINYMRYSRLYYVVGFVLDVD